MRLKSRTIILVVSVPALLGITSFLVGKAQIGWPWTFASDHDPVIEYPRNLDLGEHEIGEQLVARFKIGNRGRGELVIDQITTSCSCAGIEIDQEGKFVHLESLSLKAGQYADLAMRLSVRGVPIGTELRTTVQFRTNDPNQPVGHIHALVSRVSGGVSTLPTSVIFGTVPIGSDVRHVVDVFDWAEPPRAIERVTSTKPEQLTLRLLPIENTQAEESKRTAPRRMGRIEVIVGTQSPLEMNEAIQIHLAGEARQPDAIPVLGRVLPEVESSPSLVILPLASNTGPIYSSKCVVRSTRGEPLDLAVDSNIAGLSAQVLPCDDGADRRTVCITLDPERGKDLEKGIRHKLRFRAKVGGRETTLDLPVVCWIGGE